MGCGTGHLTKYIADIVGPDGQAVGIDPDVERIKIAEEKSKAVGNLQFYVGSSAIGFPHDNEPYYDVHISTNAFHWVPDDEKIIYIQKAHRCLKRGGKLAIWCVAKTPNEEKVDGAHFLTQEGYRDVFEEVGLFNNVVVDAPIYPCRYESFEEFKRWFKATTHQDLDPDKHADLLKKVVTIEDDGQVTCKVPCIRITACKN
jgi:ubiquinone/menaquinone biosynthesis C-methylase UbiE